LHIFSNLAAQKYLYYLINKKLKFMNKQILSKERVSNIETQIYRNKQNVLYSVQTWNIIDILREIELGNLTYKKCAEPLDADTVVKFSRIIEKALLGTLFSALVAIKTEVKKIGDCFEIVEGSEEINTFYAFMLGELRLTGLKYVQDLEGLKFEDLPDVIKTYIGKIYFEVVVCNPKMAEFLK
jgi:hypothetical protein